MTFALLALVCAVALLGPLVSLPRRLHVPVVIGELAVGLVVGRTGLRLLDAADPTFSFLAQVGFALVMFEAGTHVPVRNPALARGARVGASRAIGVGVLAVPMGWLLSAGFHTGHAALYAVVLASSSASIVMPALGGAPVRSAAGLEMLVQLALADAACIVALPLALDPGHAARAAAGTVVLVAVAALFFAVLHWAEVSGRRRRLHQVSESRGLAVELRVTLTMLFSLAAIAVQMHVSVMLAGFLMGLAMAASGEPRRVAHQTLALTQGLFGPIFFVWLGSSLDLRALASHPRDVVLGLALGVGALMVHAAPALLGQSPPLAVATAAQLGVPVGAAALGASTGVLGIGERTSLLLGALTTIVAVTVVSGRLVPLVVGQGHGPSDTTAPDHPTGGP